MFIHENIVDLFFRRVCRVRCTLHIWGGYFVRYGIFNEQGLCTVHSLYGSGCELGGVHHVKGVYGRGW